MLGIATLITMGVSYFMAKTLDDSGGYKQPEGKNKNRYK